MITVQDRAVDDFTTYVAQRRPTLVRMAHAITGDPATAEDLVHTALIRVQPRWADLRDPRAADAYVRPTMVNQHRSWFRQPWRHREHPVAELPERAADVQGGVEPDVRSVLWALVLELPPRQRTAVVLRYYEGLGEREAARALQCSIGTVKSNTSRGVANLRRMAREGGLDLRDDPARGEGSCP